MISAKPTASMFLLLSLAATAICQERSRIQEPVEILLREGFSMSVGAIWEDFADSTYKLYETYPELQGFQPARAELTHGRETFQALLPEGPVGRIDSSQVTEVLGGASCILGVSLSRSETLLAGVTLYGDFLNPGAFVYWILGASGPAGFPGVGMFTLPVRIPNDPSLLGLTTYWQGFVTDPASPAAIGFSHTGGLAVTVVR